MTACHQKKILISRHSFSLLLCHLRVNWLKIKAESPSPVIDVATVIGVVDTRSRLWGGWSTQTQPNILQQPVVGHPQMLIRLSSQGLGLKIIQRRIYKKHFNFINWERFCWKMNLKATSVARDVSISIAYLFNFRDIFSQIPLYSFQILRRQIVKVCYTSQSFNSHLLNLMDGKIPI